MATFDDNWQTKRSTISERTKFIFNNELLSDVKFVVHLSTNESESRKKQKSIPAHKFVLAISSPVFYVWLVRAIKSSEKIFIMTLSNCQLTLITSNLHL